MPKYGMAIDLDRCHGCRACMEACKVENNTAYGVFWMYVFRFEEGEYPNVKMRFMPRPCQHCDNAPCAKVCPVGARYKREDGLVATDYDRCIGCRYCQVACPYGVNYFNWGGEKVKDGGPYSFTVGASQPASLPSIPSTPSIPKFYLDWQGAGGADLKAITNGASLPYQNPDLLKPYGKEQRRIAGGDHPKGVIEKCTFCVHRVEKGLQPACAANCPASALTFGDLDDPNSKVSQLVHQKKAWQLLEENNTKPRVYYLGGTHPGTHSHQIEPVKVRV